ncbi:hypothetical protein BK124_11530 [Paenibacillus amylolyticus]|uniref:hypothetical protein n=1 Tax=Paenibacillus amylolyticus TaxID=1451 RepID=UPI00096DF81A|nr:hypothetical protein [Paenibacillus amylolyticus]OMF00281.1 hypothetical protein BK124_11530 [Paenibacillus amylolyticus]
MLPDDINVSGKLTELEFTHDRVKRLERERMAVIQEQKGRFYQVAKKLTPIFEYVRENGYDFGNPDIKDLEKLGPLIGYDSNEVVTYFYDFKAEKIMSRDLVSSEINESNADFLFVNYGFETAMKGLLDPLDRIGKVEKFYKNDIEERHNLIKRYNI